MIPCFCGDFFFFPARVFSWFLVAIIAFLTAGCASTEDLYARYENTDCPTMQTVPVMPAIAEVAMDEWHWAILFPYNSSEISLTRQQALQENLTLLQRNPEYQLILRGFTDSVASQRYNLALSERRVEAVAQWFETHGIPPEQISKHWVGKAWLLSRPVADQKEDINRRVEMLLVDARGQPVAFNTRNNTPRSPALKVSQKGLNTGLYHHRHSREGGNPSAAVVPRLRGDDGCWGDMTLCDSLALRGNADEGMSGSPERSGLSGMHSHGSRGNEAGKTKDGNHKGTKTQSKTLFLGLGNCPEITSSFCHKGTESRRKALPPCLRASVASFSLLDNIENEEVSSGLFLASASHGKPESDLCAFVPLWFNACISQPHGARWNEWKLDRVGIA